MITIVACCHGAKLCVHDARDFRSQQYQDALLPILLTFKIKLGSPLHDNQSFFTFTGASDSNTRFMICGDFVFANGNFQKYFCWSAQNKQTQFTFHQNDLTAECFQASLTTQAFFQESLIAQEFSGVPDRSGNPDQASSSPRS